MTEQHFETTVLVSLAKIEAALDQNELDHIEMKSMVAKIPKMEINLSNHLSSHTTIKNYVVNHRLVEVMCRLEQRIGDEDEPDIDLFLEEAVTQP